MMENKRSADERWAELEAAANYDRNNNPRDNHSTNERRDSMISVPMIDAFDPQQPQPHVRYPPLHGEDPFAPLAIDEGISLSKQAYSGGESKVDSSSYSHVRRPLGRFGLRGESEMDGVPIAISTSFDSSKTHGNSTFANESASRHGAYSSQRSEDWSEHSHPPMQQSYPPPMYSYGVSDHEYNPTLSPSPYRQRLRQDRAENSLYRSAAMPVSDMNQNPQHQMPYPPRDLYERRRGSTSAAAMADPFSFQPSPPYGPDTNDNLSILQDTIRSVARSAASTDPHEQEHAIPYHHHSRNPSGGSTYHDDFDMLPPRAVGTHQPYHPPPQQPQEAFHQSFSSSYEDEDEEGDSRFKPFHEEKWAVRYKELQNFHRQNGHSAVPHTYLPNPQLARWVKRQRRQCKLLRDNKPSTMTQERLELLNRLDFIWDSHEINWREKLLALDNFRHEHGHCNVPSNYVDKKLATWVKCQRRQYKLYWDGKGSAMCPRRINELESRGFEWEIRSSGPKKGPQVRRSSSPSVVANAPSSLNESEVLGSSEFLPQRSSTLSSHNSDTQQGEPQSEYKV